MASTGRKPYILQRQTAIWNRTRLQTYCWPVYAIIGLVLLLVIGPISCSYFDPSSQKCDKVVEGFGYQSRRRAYVITWTRRDVFCDNLRDAGKFQLNESSFENSKI